VDAGKIIVPPSTNGLGTGETSPAGQKAQRFGKPPIPSYSYYTQ